MLIGVPKETKIQELRVGLTPESVAQLTAGGHHVLVETHAGAGIGAGDEDYRAAGASIVANAAEVFASAQLVVKVKEPLFRERALLRPDQALFTYLHLAPDPAQARGLLESGAIAMAYETVTSPQGGLPLLAPMSIVAGRMATQVAAHYLERPNGGRGMLIGGVDGAPPARVLVIGAGTVGANAALIAAGMQGEVMLLDRSLERLQQVRAQLGPRVHIAISAPAVVREELLRADAVIGAALIPGALAPKIVTRAMLAGMKPGTVMVDVSIDQGGCFETSHPTTHDDPVFTVDGVLHYCVANMPGAVPRSSTYALNHATLPFIRELADNGIAPALAENHHLRNGLNVCRGKITSREVAEALGFSYTDPLTALGLERQRA